MNRYYFYGCLWGIGSIALPISIISILGNLILKEYITMLGFLIPLGLSIFLIWRFTEKKLQFNTNRTIPEEVKEKGTRCRDSSVENKEEK